MTMSFDRVAEVYDRTRGLPPPVMRRLVETFQRELGDCESVLDFGVGTGRFAKPLQDCGFEVVGIDIARRMIAKAREKGVDNLVRGDVRFLPFRNDCFDAAVSVHLLHLIEGWERALGELCRVTRRVMLSMFHERRDPVGEAYTSLLKERGYERHRPGKSEQDLMMLVPPARRVFVCSYEASADDRLNNMEQRAFSGQWEIPEETIAAVVKELRHQFAGKKFTQELYLLVWKIADIESYLRKA
jgi:ubiquinone/menaquinone biosynthesis C-methylase UbiE